VGSSTPRYRETRSPNAYDQDVVAAIETNLADYWMAIGNNPNGEVHNNDSVRWEYSGGPYFNRVVNADLSPQDAEDKIDEIVEEFAARQAAITWLVGPSATPRDLGERLTHHGFNQFETWKGMARHLSDPLGPAPSLPENSKAVDVTSFEQRRDWMDVIAQSYGLPQGAREQLYESVVSAERANPASWFHFLVYSDDQPVAASTLFVSENVAGIYLVATVPQARGNGLGSMATWYALDEAKRRGCYLAVLQSTSIAVNMYKKLGFKDYCDINVYRRSEPGAMWKRFAKVGVQWLRRRQSTNGRGSSWGMKDESTSSTRDEPGQTAVM
jgi:GNAT superfamily N-acetyltransferase